MLSFSRFLSKPPSLKQLPLKRYLIKFSLDRLFFGVDNIHIDVHVSPHVQSIIIQAVSAVLIKHGRCENFFLDYKKDCLEKGIAALRHVCTEVLREGINRAKAESEVQVDFLGQFSLAKMFMEEIHNEYRKLIEKFEILIRDYELSRQYDQDEWFKMKEKLNEIKQEQRRIIRLVGEELFLVLADVHAHRLKNIRESNFPAEDILPANIFINPTLHTDNVADDFLLMDSYVLIGQRSEEPDNYARINAIIHDILSKTDLVRAIASEDEKEISERKEADIPSEKGNVWDPWLMELDNIDIMFNCFDSKAKYEMAKGRKESAGILLEFKSHLIIQEKLLNLFYKRFNKSGLLKRIVAAYETKSVYRLYCPPLRPVQIREYLAKPGSRKHIVRELKSRKSFNGSKLSLAPLHEAISRINRCFTRKKKEYLLGFLKDFLRYHRDLENGRLLKEAMGAINLVRDEKILLLSRKNLLLYDFPLPEERVKEEKPIVSHVIIKADIRGSMDITQKMIAKGLNPASYFSLNFFDPISELVRDYNASKEFIEGDAIILSIFENEDNEQDWYSVARACGLAVSMLHIVHQYNVKNKKYDLPILELGIGICYRQSPPAYLFDGDSRIMISHAINLADRLSGCDKRLRKRFQNQDRPFNLLVYQSSRDEEIEDTADNPALRYNVNGIELDPEGFGKLSKEISLKSIKYPAESKEMITLYTGKVPTLSGKYQRLVIREAAILEVAPETMDVIGPTSRKYYEVCTQQSIYEFIGDHT